MKHLVLFCTILFSGWSLFFSEAVAAQNPLIAVIMANSTQRFQEIHQVFVDNSTSFCTSDCKVYVQTPNADVMSLRNSVRKAVALGADVIINYGPAASLAAKAEVSSIPVLFAYVYDPVGLGLVSSKTLVGRNMTGIRGDAPVQSLLKYFVETTKAKKLAILYDVNSPEGTLQKQTLEESGKLRGVETISVPIKNKQDHLSAFEAIPTDTDGLFLTGSEHRGNYLPHVLAAASERKLPVISQRPGTSEAGVFMVLETGAAEQGEKLAEMVGQVLSGRDLEEIPMRRPHQVEFVVNMKISKDYSLQIPLQILSVASRIVR